MSYQKGRRTMAPKKKEKNLNQIAKHFNSGGSQSRAIENEIHQCITDLFLLKKGMYVSSGTPSNRSEPSSAFKPFLLE